MRLGIHLLTVIVYNGNIEYQYLIAKSVNMSRIHFTCTYLGEIAKLDVNKDVADDNSEHERAGYHDCSNAREFQSRIALRVLITFSGALEVHPAVLQRLTAHR